MQENIQKYHPLGSKTLFMMIFRRSSLLILLVPFLFVALFLLNYIPSQYINIAINIIFGYIAFLLIFLISTSLLGSLEYYRYSIFVDDKDLKIARGLVATEQIGIPYRHIKDLKIERSLLDQIIGVSDMVITVLGSEDDIQFKEGKSTIILPAIEEKIALQIQDIVLRKVQVEQVNVLGGKIG